MFILNFWLEYYIMSVFKDLEYISEQNRSTLFSQGDLDKICKMCDIAWNNYFSKPLPGYQNMQVYWNGKLQLFRELNRNDQIEVIKSAHVPQMKAKELDKEKNSTTDIETIIHRVVLFCEGHLLIFHGIGHAVRAAIMAGLSSISYLNNFKEFQTMSSRTLLCSISASLLHDIGRCFGGDGSDIFGTTSAHIAGDILAKVGGFTDDEIFWIKEAIEIGGIHEKDVKNIQEQKCDFLNERQMIACIMGDADSYEFERFSNCDIKYTSIKKLALLRKDGSDPEEVLNNLKRMASALCERIKEPGKNVGTINYTTILRNELMKVFQS